MVFWKLHINTGQQRKSVVFDSLLGKESGLKTVFMGHRNPRGNNSNIKIRAGNLAGTETEMLWPTGRETEGNSPCLRERIQLTVGTGQRMEAQPSGLWHEIPGCGAAVQGRNERPLLLSLPDTARFLDVWPRYGAPVWTTVEKEMYSEMTF